MKKKCVCGNDLESRRRKWCSRDCIVKKEQERKKRQIKRSNKLLIG